MPRDLIERAVAHHTDLAWVKLYVGRWLRAPVEHPDGTRVERTKGTPQGGVVSPLLANLFLHYAFDRWMARVYPDLRFERYAAMRSSIAGARRRLGLFWRPSGVAWRTAVWSFIPRRPGSSTARTTTGRGRTNTSRSTSSATPSNRDGRRTGGDATSSAFCRRSAPRLRRRSGRPSATGGWRPPGTTSAWRIWLALRTRWCRAG